MIVLVAALIARLVPLVMLPMGAGFDIDSFQIVGKLVLNGEDVYTSPLAISRYPYLPAQMYWMALAQRLAIATGASFTKIVKLAPVGADIGIALLIFMLLYQRTKALQPAFLGGLLYALNPIPVLVSAYHGQFDSIPLLMVLLATASFPRSAGVAGGWLGLGILDKSWPILILPSLFTSAKDWKARWHLVFSALLIPSLGVLLYWLLFRADMPTIVARALTYNHGIGIWGYTYFFRLLSLLSQSFQDPFRWIEDNSRLLTLLGLGFVWFVRARKQSPERAALTILVAFFALTHAFAIQYLVWLVPFATLERDQVWLTRYTLAAFAYMFLAYTTLVLGIYIDNVIPLPQADYFIIMPAGLPAWFVTVGWLIKRLGEPLASVDVPMRAELESA